jgi:hypothetical protein
MGLRQADGGEALGDVGLEPGGQIGRGTGVGRDPPPQLGLGVGEGRGVPDPP